MLTGLIFPIISLIVFWLMIIFVALMVIRLIYSFADPNPFGKVGRLGYNLRRLTDRYVQPFADFLYIYRIDRKYAPILTAIIFCVLAYFALQIIGNTLYIIDGFIRYSAEGNISAIIGFVLYTLLSIYILLIFLRIISSWFVYTQRTFFGFVRRATDPVMLPVRRLIPPVGMFDLSAMLVLILLSVLQVFVLRIFVA